MFKSAAYHHRNIYGAAVHLLKDDAFTSLVEVDSGGLALSIVQAYKDHKLPIAPNMALYYLWCHYPKRELSQLLERDCVLITFAAPAWNYRDTIHPCVLRQLKQRTWSRV